MCQTPRASRSGRLTATKSRPLTSPGDVHLQQPLSLSLKLPHVRIPPHIWLLLPAVLLLVGFFLFPLLNMIKFSFYTQVPGGTMQPDVTLANFERFFANALYGKILLKTLFNALLTTLLALALGYPVAFAIARGRPWLARILIIAVISPLLVGIVIRTYGWTVLLSRQGLINQLLRTVGIVETPVRFMGTDLGIVISLLHVFYPFMVFPLTASSFVTTRLIGQNLIRWFLNLVEEQVLIVFNWPFGAAMATLFIVILVLIITGYHRVLESKLAFLTRGKER